MLAAVIVAAGVSLTASASAFATELPSSSSPTCKSGVPKVDYEYNTGYSSSYWENQCGDNTWAWNGTLADLIAVRMPTFPTHRIWVHYESYNGAQYSLCIWAPDVDVKYSEFSNAGYPSPQTIFLNPYNLQVSSNTTPC